jgi:hypothetical protein
MELMRMDERQRLAWFMANRGTVIAVGAVWIGMIGWELTHGRVPAFLLIMVPVFALFRAGLYFFYSARPFAGSNAEKDPGFVRYGKAVAAVLLALAAALPIYTVPDTSGTSAEYRYTWDFVQGDATALPVLAIAYLWPVLVFGLMRLRSRRVLQWVVQFAEPALAVASSIVILWIPQLIFETRVLFFILHIPVDATAAWGCFLAVVANGLYLVSWLAGRLRPWGVQGG